MIRRSQIRTNVIVTLIIRFFAFPGKGVPLITVCLPIGGLRERDRTQEAKAAIAEMMQCPLFGS
jgi:hypothetical protein